MNEKLKEKLKEINLELENFDKDNKIINNTILKIAKWCNKINEQIKNELELRIEQQDILGGVRFFFEFINIKENFILELQIEARKSTIIECDNETASVRKISFNTSVNAYEYDAILCKKTMGVKLKHNDLTREKLNLFKKNK